MLKFYTRCPQVLDEVLALKGTIPVAMMQSGRRSSRSAKLLWIRIFLIMMNKFDVILGASVQICISRGFFQLAAIFYILITHYYYTLLHTLITYYGASYSTK